jgi:hypothetical protein
MKKIFNILTVLTATSAVMFTACSKKIDEAYANPNANVRQPIELILPNVIANLCISNTAQGTLYGPQNDGQYVGRYVQYWATNSATNQYDLMGQTTTQSTAAAADIGGSHWAMHYYGMGQNITKIIEWGTEEKKWDYVGVGHALRAFGWLTTTDMHGEIIVKDAFNTSKLVFDYDDQATVYEEVKKECWMALDYLSRTGDGVSPANLAKGAQYFSYQGDATKWKKFVYAILARVHHRITNKSTYNPDSVITYCNNSIKDNSDNAYVLFEGGTSVKMSYYGPTRGNIGTFRQTKFAADLFSGVNSTFTGTPDPRAWYMLRENFNGTFKGIREGKGYELNSPLVANDQPFNYWGGGTTTPTATTYTSTAGGNTMARYIWQDAMPWPIITSPEIHFMMAEAYYRKGAAYKTQSIAAYQEGIRQSFNMLMADYNTNVPVAKQVTPGIRDAFVASVTPAPANFKLSHIMLQKYIALYGYGFLETWVDMRRYHYTDMEAGTTTQVYADFAPPALADLFINNNQKYIYRVRPRYNSEFLYNIDALQKIGALALDYHTKEQWFSQP